MGNGLNVPSRNAHFIKKELSYMAHSLYTDCPKFMLMLNECNKAILIAMCRGVEKFFND